MDTKGRRILYYEDGEVIFEKDSMGSEMYIIESGKVEVSLSIRGRKTTIAVLEKGDFLGEMAIFTGAPRSATATAIGATALMPFSREDILQRMQADPQFAIDLLQTLISRLRSTTSTLGILIAKVYDFGDGVMDGLFPEIRPREIGEILVEMGCLTRSQLDRSLQRQKEVHKLERRDKSLGEIMVESGIITGEELRSALAEQRIRLRRESD